MFTPVTLPLWVALTLGALAAVAVMDRLFLPSARWFLRRRVNRLVDRLNQRLPIRLQPFKLTKRAVLVERLRFDPQVMKAVEEEAAAQGMPRDVAMAKVARYADEIVPSFNAYLYFRIAYRVARSVARSIYRVRLGSADEEALAAVPPGSTVVFLMNHRSNMDYVLVAYLAADRTALSYAVGEWARIWPLHTLIRSMGAYFVRRGSGNSLYRRVLERYVAMATSEGVTQAVYPEGGLSRDGKLRPPRLGLLDYMLRSFDPTGERDLVFVPIGINYDRVLEDRTLLLDVPASGEGEKARPASPVPTTLRFLAKQLGLVFTGRWHRMGYACVNFGAPISIRGHFADRGGLDLRRLGKEERMPHVEQLGRELMARIGDLVPVLPVPLVATVVLRDPTRAWPALTLKAEALALAERLRQAGAQVYLPRGDEEYAFDVGLRMLTLRRLIVATSEGGYRAVPAELPVLEYYANSISHLAEAAAP
ncbi:MAG: 1-acyl-sn-glycerol-3-phosphate acyltransferase [Thermoanaerobaculia bacterium]|nr:1-acyl-sn-glycerol-3-phosphate acyltransferase [Thermoanaerobaculia bacterium]